MEYYNYLKSCTSLVITWFWIIYIVRLFVYQIEATKNLHQRKKFSKQYKIMTYRLWYIIFILLLLAFCFLDVVFTDLGRLGWKCLDARETWLCICAYTMQNAIYKQLQNDEVHFFHAFVGRRTIISC
jgi:putative membrane protein